MASEAYLEASFAARGLLTAIYLRQVGGAVPATARALAVTVGGTPEEIAPLVAELEALGLITRDGSRWTLPHFASDLAAERRSRHADRQAEHADRLAAIAHPCIVPHNSELTDGEKTVSSRQQPSAAVSEQATPACAHPPARVYDARVRAGADTGVNKSTTNSSAKRLANLEIQSEQARARATPTPAQEEPKPISAEHAAAIARWQRERAERAPSAIVGDRMLSELAAAFGPAFLAAVDRHIDETDPAVWTPNPLRYLRRRCEWARDDEATPRTRGRPRSSAGAGFLVRSPPVAPQRDLDAEDARDLAEFIAAQAAAL